MHYVAWNKIDPSYIGGGRGTWRAARAHTTQMEGVCIRRRRESSRTGMQVRVWVNATRCTRESVNTTNMMCMYLHSHRRAPAECVSVNEKRAEEGCQRARLGSSLNLCERMCICNHSLFECTCQIVRMRGNANVYMYEKVQICKNIYVCKKPTSCRIKAGIYMCAEKK